MYPPWGMEEPPSGGRGRPCSRRGHGPCGDAPPIFFSILWKRKRAVHGPKAKTALVATLHVCAKLLYGGRRIGASADLARPSGTLWSSASLQLPSRAGWCRRRRGARTHLTSFSFRAFRFTRKGYAASVSGRAANGCAAATRCPGGRRGRPVCRPLRGCRKPVGADALIGPVVVPAGPHKDA